MKTKLMLAALLASAAFAQATPAISTPQPKRTLHLSQVRGIFHRAVQRPSAGSPGQKIPNGPFANHPETAPGPH